MRIVCAAAGFLMTPLPAWACERDPILFRLEGETLLDAQQRAKGVDHDHRIKQAIDREESAWALADVVYLGTVTEAQLSKSSPGRYEQPSTVVKPLISLKGTLPKSARRLTGEPAGGLCQDRGDGFAAFAAKGQLVVVFEGLAVSEDRPRGIDSLDAVDVRSMPVLNALWVIGEDLSQ